MKEVRTLVADQRNRQVSSKLTAKQWIVYYYLMSICNWNGKDRENHYFIYRKDLNITQAAKLLGLSRPTIYKTIEKLVKDNIVNDKNKEYYLIKIPQIFASIDQATLKFLVSFQSEVGVDLIRTYAILCRINQHKELDQHFNKATLISILGHAVNDTSQYKRMEVYLAMLQHWELIDVRYKIVESNTGHYKDFLLMGIGKINDNFEIDTDMVVIKDLVEQIRQEIISEGIWDISM